MKRSDVRHALFRMKNGQPKVGCEELYEVVESMIPTGHSWNTFGTGWDVLIKNGQVLIIKPETDYNYVHSTCLEYSLCAKNNVKPDFDPRQANVIAIVESTMLDGKMTWANYNKNWGLTIDEDRGFIQTKLFATQVNEVTPEMIRNSAKSDGAAMTAVPELPKVEVSDFKPTVLTDAQRALIEHYSSKGRTK